VTAFQVRFPNGSRIISLSSNPRAFAGKGGDILIDEMDLHDDQAPLYDMAMPCTDWGGQLEIVSAYDPEGSTETVFAKLVEESKSGNPKGWSLHEVTLEQAVGQGLVEKINAAKKKRGYKTQTRAEFTETQYRKCRTVDSRNSQYRCIPVNAANQMVVRPQDLAYAKRDYTIVFAKIEGNARAGDKVDPVVRTLYEGGIWEDLLEAYPKARWSLGVDVARTTHLASVWLDAWEGETAVCAAVLNLHNCKFESLEELSRRAMRRLRARGCGDRTGLGMQMCENLAFDFPDRFEGVDFGSQKNDLGTRLIQIFEEARQVLPREPLCVAGDIGCIRKATSTATTKLVFAETENQYEPDSHADMAWACALSKRAGMVAAGLAAGMLVDTGRGAGARAARGTRGPERLFAARPDEARDLAPAGGARRAW